MTTASAEKDRSRSSRIRYCDIGANLTVADFHGGGARSSRHLDDWSQVLARAKAAGVEKMIVTAGSLEESRDAIALAKEHDGLYATVGCHPTRASELLRYKDGPLGYINAMGDLVRENTYKKGGKVVALGECGLDFDRLHFSPKDDQIMAFRLQLEHLVTAFGLPLFLHSRTSEAFQQLKLIIEEYRSQLQTIYPEEHPRHQGRWGCVHSHTGTLSEAQEIIDLGFCVGLNGCSLKTEENLIVAQSIPLDHLMVETDAPFCGISSTHASFPYLKTLPSHLAQIYDPPSVKKDKFDQKMRDLGSETEGPPFGYMIKGRNEPCAIGKIAWVLSQSMELQLNKVTAAAWDNTMRVYFSRENEASLDSSFTTRSLWGGAATIDLPSSWLDASELRQVPDNQEVYLSYASPGDVQDPNASLGADCSIVAELLEPPSEQGGEGSILKHFDALSQDNHALSASVISVIRPESSNGQLVQDRKSQSRAEPFVLHGINLCRKFDRVDGGDEESQMSKSVQRPLEKVSIWMALWNLPEVQSDLVITCSIPLDPSSSDLESYMKHMKLDPEKSSSEKLDIAKAVFDRAIASFELRDWTLFG